MKTAYPMDFIHEYRLQSVRTERSTTISTYILRDDGDPNRPQLPLRFQRVEYSLESPLTTTFVYNANGDGDGVARPYEKIDVITSSDPSSPGSGVTKYSYLNIAIPPSLAKTSEVPALDLSDEPIVVVMKFPKKSGHPVKDYSDFSYSAGERYPSEECKRIRL